MATSKKEAKVKFSAETQQFDTNLKKAESSLKTLNAEAKLNEAVFKNGGDKMEYMEQKCNILTAQIGEQIIKQNELSNEIEVAKRIFGEDSEEVANLERKLIQASTAQNNFQLKLKAANQEMEAEKEATNSASTALESLSQTISQQEVELTKLKSDLSNAFLEYGEASPEVKELENAVQQLSAELNQNQSKLSAAKSAAEDAANAMDDLGDAAEGAGDSAQASGDGWTITKDIIADFAKDALKSAAEGFKELATEGEQALNKLDAATGASDSQMQKYKEVMKDVYNNNFGDSMDDVGESMSTILQIMGDMDKESLQGVTENALSLRDVFGMDVSESVRTANSLMDKFGISSDEAFNLIAQGAQNGLNQNDDLLDTINEYSVQFASAGFSADDMFNMLANGANQGTWSIDKLGDAVKEYNINWKDGTAHDSLEKLGFNADEMSKKMGKGGKEAGQAMQEVIAAIMKTEDEQERYQLGQAIMGTMWEDLGEDAVKALMNTNGEIDKSKKAMDDVKSTAYDDIASSAEGLGRTLKNDIISPVVDTCEPVIKDFLGYVNQNLPTIEPILVGIGTAITIIGGAMTAIKIASMIKNLALLGGGLAAIGGPVTLVIALIAAVAAGFAFAYTHSEKFRNGFNQTVTQLKNDAVGLFNGTVSAITGIPGSVSKIFTDTTNKVGTAVTGMVTSVSNKYTEIKNRASAAVTGMKTAVVNKFTETKNKAVSTVTGMRAAVVNKYTEVKNKATSTITGMRTAVVNKFTETKNKAVSTVTGMKTAVVNKFTETKNKAVSTVTGMKTAVVNKFTEIVNTARQKFSSLKEKITSPVANAVSKVKSLIDKMKGYFHFSWSLPHLKVPHISISGGFSIKPPRAPSFHVTWRKEGVIFTKPTLLNGGAAGIQGVGEAGYEAVLPLERLRGFIGETMESFVRYIPQIDYDKMGQAFRDAVEGMENVIVVDKRVLGRLIREYL